MPVRPQSPTCIEYPYQEQQLQHIAVAGEVMRALPPNKFYPARPPATKTTTHHRNGKHNRLQQQQEKTQEQQDQQE